MNRSFIKQRNATDEMHCDSTDAVFIIREHLAANMLFNITFVDLEKAFNYVTWDFIWSPIHHFYVILQMINIVHTWTLYPPS